MLSLPSVLPARTIHTPLRLLTNILPAKLALDLLLHYIIVCTSGVCKRNDPQRQCNANEAHDFIEERPVGEDDSPIVQRLRNSIVASGYRAVVVWTVL